MPKWLSVAALALVALLCAAYAAFHSLNGPVSAQGAAAPNLAGGDAAAAGISMEENDESAVLFAVNQGMSIKEIAARLEGAGLIRASFFAALYTQGAGLSLKAGTYLLAPSMTTAEILGVLDSGDVAVLKITVPEGLTLPKTALCFAPAGISQEDFVAAARDDRLLSEFGIAASSAEGYLFPDTYFVSYDEGAESVVRRMVSTFFGKAAALECAPSGGEALHEKVILASIVEREYRVADEAPVIAGIFENRLKANMRLQSCATVEYVITEIEGKPHPERLLSADLEIESEFNTYRNAGLPPSPISNPGLTALAAAFSPAETPYFYFRLNDAESGTHAFTVSLDDHIEAGREFYLKAAAGGQ